MGEDITLYDAEDDESIESIEVEIDDLYSDMLDSVDDSVEVDVEQVLSRTIETAIHKSIQQLSEDSTDIHEPYAHLIIEMIEREDIDLKSLVESSIHNLKQGVDE